MTIKIELNANDCAVITREANGNTFHEQQAYLHTGSAYPMPFKIPLRNPGAAKPSGQYTLDPSSFKVNQYQALELDRWNLKLIPLKATAVPKAG